MNARIEHQMPECQNCRELVEPEECNEDFQVCLNCLECFK